MGENATLKCLSSVGLFPYTPCIPGSTELCSEDCSLYAGCSRRGASECEDCWGGVWSETQILNTSTFQCEDPSSGRRHLTERLLTLQYRVRTYFTKTFHMKKWLRT